MSATVVSICPFETIEEKPGMVKGRFKIPACEEGGIVVFPVEDSFYTVRMPATDIHINVPVPAMDIARSIVNDFIGCHIAADENAHPGMFAVPGKISKTTIITSAELKALVDEQRAYQREWFKSLVKLADDDWEQYKMHKLINPHQRYAATILKLDRPWNVDYDPMATTPTKQCPACFSDIDARASVCAVCRTDLNTFGKKAG